MLNVKLKTGSGADANGAFNPKSKKIRIKAGSILTIDPDAREIPSNIQQNYKTAKLLVQSGALRQIPMGKYKVMQDIPELSVSGSSVIVTGKAGSGWMRWKLEDGQLLNVVRSSSQAKTQSPHLTSTQANVSIAGKGESGLATPPDKTTITSKAGSDSCESLACKFIDYLKARSHASVDLSSQMDWFDGALTASAGSGNPSGAKMIINTLARTRIELIVADLFRTFASQAFCGQSGFDYLFREAIHQIEVAVHVNSPGTSFSFGRAQKILNIIIKYCYVWLLCKHSDSPRFGDISWINKWKPYFHVPVDRETIKHLKTKGELYQALPCFQNGNLISWKWKMTEHCYLVIQDAVRELAFAAGFDPICYEMKYIWVAGNNNS